MFGNAWLNVVSLLLGLAAWALPLAALVLKRGNAFAFTSFCSCIFSLLSVILSLAHVVEIRDWSALMDTIGAFVFAATVLVIGTLLLNLALVWKKR